MRSPLVVRLAAALLDVCGLLCGRVGRPVYSGQPGGAVHNGLVSAARSFLVVECIEALLPGHASANVARLLGLVSTGMWMARASGLGVGAHGGLLCSGWMPLCCSLPKYRTKPSIMQAFFDTKTLQHNNLAKENFYFDRFNAFYPASRNCLNTNHLGSAKWFFKCTIIKHLRARMQGPSTSPGDASGLDPPCPWTMLQDMPPRPRSIKYCMTTKCSTWVFCPCLGREEAQPLSAVLPIDSGRPHVLYLISRHPGLGNDGHRRTR